MHMATIAPTLKAFLPDLVEDSGTRDVQEKTSKTGASVLTFRRKFRPKFEGLQDRKGSGLIETGTASQSTKRYLP